MSSDVIDLPAGLAARPRDTKRGVPIPYVSVHDDGEDGQQRVDYVAINGARVLECARDRLCGLCGQGLGYWIAFLGGPRAAEHRRYLDPPMHEECARAAIALCPHIAVHRHTRAPDHRVHDDATTPADFDESKPDEWVLGVTRSFELRATSNSLQFLPAPFKRIHRFTYAGNGIVEVQS